MTICDKCRMQNGTIRIYGFGRWGENIKNTFELCDLWIKTARLNTTYIPTWNN